ncbi:MAG: hypothetical protein RIS86_572 [Planctomycetota bacterium]
MQLALIVQLSIAMLAGELAGTLPATPAVGAGALVAGPAACLLIGALLAARAVGGMDRRDHRAVDRALAFRRAAPWLATAPILLAASSALPTAIDEVAGPLAVTTVLLLSGVLSILATEAALWPVERRLREAVLVRELDAGRTVHPVPTRGAFVLAKARAGLGPFLVPLLVPVVASEAARVAATRAWPDHVAEAQLAGAAAGALLLFATVPLLVPFLLGLERMAPGPMRDDLAALSRAAGVRVRDIWVWPTHGLSANAAVMGVLPGLRCVMLTDALLECLPRDEVRAVMAHELGHVARRHMPWLLVVILGAWAAAALVATPLVSALVSSLGERFADGLDDAGVARLADLANIARDGTALVLGLWLFGYASRRFERDADTYAVELLSREEGSSTATAGAVAAMRGALGTVAFLGHVPAERPSWRHGSIAWRQSYLASIESRPLDGLPIRSTVALLEWGAVAALAASVALALLGG